MKNKSIIFGIIFLMTVLGLGRCLTAQTVSHAPETISPLDAGWDWAFNAAKQKNISKGFYVAYMFQPNTKHRVCMGRHSHYSTTETTFNELVYGKKAAESLDKKSEPIVLVFLFDKTAKDKIKDLKIGHPSQHMTLKDLPLFWLGKKEMEKSAAFMETYFKLIHRTATDDIQKEMVTAVGVHGRSPRVFRFLEKILAGNYKNDVRESAVFWIADQEEKAAFKIIKHTIYNDRSKDVRKDAVFALYRIPSTEATDLLIDLAKNGKEKPLRKQAIFWLGQKAAKRSAEVLGNLAENDKDFSIRKAAVFALSQLPDGAARLVKIAKSHGNLKLRKQAIFWLSQMDDPIALKTIIEILESPQAAASH